MKIRVTIDSDEGNPEVEILEGPNDLGDYSVVSYGLAQTGVLFLAKVFEDDGVAVPTKMLKNKFNEVIDKCLDNK